MRHEWHTILFTMFTVSESEIYNLVGLNEIYGRVKGTVTKAYKTTFVPAQAWQDETGF